MQFIKFYCGSIEPPCLPTYGEQAFPPHQVGSSTLTKGLLYRSLKIYLRYLLYISILVGQVQIYEYPYGTI